MSQVSQNQPLRDVFDVRENYFKIGLPLHEASIKCDWKAAEAILNNNTNMNLLSRSITENGETALHIAASAKASKKVDEFVQNLVDRMEEKELELENNNKSTALYLAAATGNIKTVKIMMERNPSLDKIPGGGGDIMPLYAAVLYGNEDVARYLYECSRELRNDGWTDRRRTSLLEKCVESDMFDIATQIVNEYPELGRNSNSNLLGLLARKPEAFRFPEKKSWNIIRRTIRSGSMKDMVTTIIDKDENNMLHLAAMRTRKKNLENVIGAALQVQRELLWFKEVERMVPPFLREKKNKDGFTPRELFTNEHQDLINQGEKWMKQTASQCMVVATLIATIVFAAAFTVPGGYNQNDGTPMFEGKLTFVTFVIADAISLTLSSASILIFFSFSTSRYAELDFVASSPMKLMLGLVTLFLSIGGMMVTFSVSFFVLYHKETKWIPIFISLFAIIPAILYVALQFHLLVDIVRSTYDGKYLFKPKKQVLFYKNPKV